MTFTMSTGKTISIYWGSQTGTAEYFCSELKEELKSRYNVEIIDLEDFETDKFQQQRIVVFCVSTYGEGDPPDNAVKFENWLKKSHKLPKDYLSGQRYAVMGCGNSQYVNYNAMAKLVDRCLKNLGSRSICVRGEGDDDGDIEEDFSKWKKIFVNAVELLNESDVSQQILSPNEKTEYPRACFFDSIESAPVQFRFCENVENIKNDDSRESNNVILCKGRDIVSNSYFKLLKGGIISSRELLQKPDPKNHKSTVHLVIDVSKIASRPTFSAGDTISILPPNDMKSIMVFARLLSLPQEIGNGHSNNELRSAIHHMNKQIIFTPENVSSSSGDSITANSAVFLVPFPLPCTIEHALMYFVDLNYMPPKPILNQLTNFLENHKEQIVLKRLLSQESEQDYQQFFKNSKFPFAVFATLFLSSLKLDVSTFMHLIPRQRPRDYTISSSEIASPGYVTITVAQTIDQTPPLKEVLKWMRPKGYLSIIPEHKISILESLQELRDCRLGLCSSYLCKNVKEMVTVVQTEVEAYFIHRPSKFRIPKDKSIPMVMICTGTGVAPFRGFLRELISDSPRTAEVILIYGCRHADEDWLYRDEMLDSVMDHALPKHCLGGFENLSSRMGTTEFGFLKERRKMRENRQNPSHAHGVVTHLYCAFSRKEDDNKVYVQDLMKEYSSLLTNIIWDRSGHVFVCGSFHLGISMNGVLTTLAESYLSNKTPTAGVAEAQLLAANLMSSDRYYQETWDD